MELFNNKISTLENQREIVLKKNVLIKKKLLLTFDENLYNELLNSKQIDMEFFTQCIKCCLQYDLTNLPNLLKFSSIHSPEYSQIIIKEFVQMEMNENNHKNIEIQIYLSCIEMFLQTFITNNNLPDVILLSKLII